MCVCVGVGGELGAVEPWHCAEGRCRPHIYVRVCMRVCETENNRENAYEGWGEGVAAVPTASLICWSVCVRE